MRSAKNEVARILEALPEDCSLDDIQYHLYVLQKIELGLKDEGEGRTIPQDRVKERMEKWLVK